MLHIATPFVALALLLSACSSSGDATTTTVVTATTESERGTTSAGPTTAPPPTRSSDTTATTTPVAPPATSESPTHSTTTTSRPRATTTSAPRTTTTAGGNGDNRPPTVAITSPAPLTRYRATYDPNSAQFGATVQLSASASDPDLDDIEIEWFSDVDGYLGSGASVAARLTTRGDVSQPNIRVRVTDAFGAVAEAAISLIVWIPSAEG